MKSLFENGLDDNIVNFDPGLSVFARGDVVLPDAELLHGRDARHGHIELTVAERRRSEHQADLQMRI